GDVDHQAGGERLAYQLPAGAVELDADHRSHAAQLGDARAAADGIGEAATNRGADALGVGEQAFFLHRVDGRAHRGHGERVAAEGRAMVAGLEHAPRAAADHAGADRYSRAETLGERHDVGHETRVLVHEPFAGAAETALHLVGHEQPVLALAELVQAAQVFEAGDVDAALALDRLDEYGGDVLVVLGDVAHGLEVVERHSHKARDERLEPGLHLAAAGGRQRGERAAVERLLHHHNGRLGDAALMPVLARDLDRAFIGF